MKSRNHMHRRLKNWKEDNTNDTNISGETKSSCHRWYLRGEGYSGSENMWPVVAFVTSFTWKWIYSKHVIPTWMLAAVQTRECSPRLELATFPTKGHGLPLHIWSCQIKGKLSFESCGTVRIWQIYHEHWITAAYLVLSNQINIVIRFLWHSEDLANHSEDEVR
jgi:hypothetical protein